MTYTAEVIEAAHRQSINHRAELEQSAICGCFHCRGTFEPPEIGNWIDGDRTALCPRCGVDAVIGSASGFPVQERAFLEAMRRRWF